MKHTIWLAIGIIAIAAANSLSYVFDSHWLGFFAALSVALVLMVLMSRQFFREIESTGIKKAVTILFLGLAVIHIYNSVYSWIKTENQKTVLTEIRQTIDGSIAQMEAEKLLIKSLRYKFDQEEEITLEEAFTRVFGDQVRDDDTIAFADERIGEDLNFTAEIPQPDSILIHIDADIAKGDDPAFSNRSGNTGKYQAVAILTSNGVRYVRQN